MNQPLTARCLRFLDNDMVHGPDAELGELRSANHLLADLPALRAQFATDGYLLIRNLHPRDEVLTVRRQMLEILDRNGRIDHSHPLDEAWIAANPGVAAGGGIGDAPGFIPQVEHPRLMEFFARFLDGQPLTYDFKWTREVGTGEATGAHLDVVYMGRGTPHLLTCWTPWGDIAPEQGTLAILVGSHRLPAWERVHATYGRMDVDRDHVDGWFSNDPRHLAATYGGQWATTTFSVGDVLIFGMRTIHASTTNTTPRFRLTSDTRYQLAAEPVDERWMSKAGTPPRGHYAWHAAPTVPMADKLQEWGLAKS